MRCTTGVWSGSEVPAGSDQPLPQPTAVSSSCRRRCGAVDTRDLPGQARRGPHADGADRRRQRCARRRHSRPGLGDRRRAVRRHVPDSLPMRQPRCRPRRWSTPERCRSSPTRRWCASATGRCASTRCSRPTCSSTSADGWRRAACGSTPLAPVRLVDTRPGEQQTLPVAQHRLEAGELLTVDVAALPGVDPAAVAATVNVTAANPSRDGFVSVLPGPCASATAPADDLQPQRHGGSRCCGVRHGRRSATASCACTAAPTPTWSSTCRRCTATPAGAG